MKIDTHHGWFKGLGDLVCFAWIGETLRAHGIGAEFYAEGWRAELLRAFGQRVTGEPGGYRPECGYETAVITKSRLHYLAWIAFQCGFPAYGIDLPGDRDFVFERPRLDLPPLERELGRAASAQVLVFPQGHWTPRVWPRNYYVELCHRLKRHGCNVAVVLTEPDAAFSQFRTIAGQSLLFVAAMMQRAELVIGNDSGPAHLAGTLGRPVLAIHGPTTERIFAHLPEVTCLRKRALDCAGCHCLEPFRASCELGCHELYRTFPETVAEQALRLLGSETRNQKLETGKAA
ncbi:MAG: glycosyltransferase family 9 protein [Candidatus Acidoferrales bacterium]|nr:glycosyltransferase family 9 protein [Candidatus Acidoferrales bacterium]